MACSKERKPVTLIYTMGWILGTCTKGRRCTDFGHVCPPAAGAFYSFFWGGGGTAHGTVVSVSVGKWQNPYAPSIMGSK